MEEVLIKIKEKFNYSDELMLFIQNIIPIMIEYYGYEYSGKIISGFLNNPIILTDKGIKEELNDVTDEYNTTAGVYKSDTIMENGVPVNRGRVIVSVESEKLDFSNTIKIGTLVHELCHMVKSGANLDVKNNKIIWNNGLMKSSGIMRDGSFIEESYNNGEGLEESLNKFDEINIMNRLYGNYSSNDNVYSRLLNIIGNSIIENELLMSKIKESQMTGNNAFDEFVGYEIAEKFRSLCNRHLELMNSAMAVILNDELFENWNKELSKTEKDIMDILAYISELSKSQEL